MQQLESKAATEICDCQEKYAKLFSAQSCQKISFGQIGGGGGGAAAAGGVSPEHN